MRVSVCGLSVETCPWPGENGSLWQPVLKFHNPTVWQIHDLYAFLWAGTSLWWSSRAAAADGEREAEGEQDRSLLHRRTEREAEWRDEKTLEIKQSWPSQFQPGIYFIAQRQNRWVVSLLFYSIWDCNWFIRSYLTQVCSYNSFLNTFWFFFFHSTSSPWPLRLCARAGILFWNTLHRKFTVFHCGCLNAGIFPDRNLTRWTMALPWLLLLELALYISCFVCGIVTAAAITIVQVTSPRN